MIGFLAPILLRMDALWKWLTENPVRLAFIALLAVCAFLAFRLASIDGSRDAWRSKAQAYEKASTELKAADKKADTAATEKAAETKGQVDAGNERAKRAADGSDDPLRSGLGSLRAEADSRRGQAAR